MRAAPLAFAARARGALLGALAGGGEAPLLEILAEELAAGRTDLRLLARRWVERHQASRAAGDPETTAALDFLARHDAPPREGGSGDGALARGVPVAIVARRAPRTLVSATYHIAALTHPAPEAAWSAVAVNVALSRLLDGKRDVVADVIEALAGNDAPARVVNAVRRVPVTRREELPSPAECAADAVRGMELALGLAYHEPVAARGLQRVRPAGADGSASAAAAGALLGARDGDAALAAEWLPPQAAARWVDLADRLALLAPAPA